MPERGGRMARRWLWRSFLTLLVIVAATDLVVSVTLSPLGGRTDVTGVLVSAAASVAISSALMWLFVVRPIWVGLGERDRRVMASEERLRAQSEAYAMNGQILRALEMAVTEDDVMTVTKLAVGAVCPERPAEAMMADSSQAHLTVTMVTDDGGPGCPVQSPMECPAVRAGHGLAFRSATDIDACPKLRDRDSEGISAVCVPISVLGRATGVVHVTSGAGHPIEDDVMQLLRDLGAAVGRRLSLVRALSDSQRQASSDPLTGLMNRRTVEDRVAAFDRGARPYAVIALDLDHFKAINDTHGHASGDQALRLFARATTDVTRAGDMVARYGGEEFVIVLPDADTAAATALAERVRMHLMELLAAGTVPPFTVSGGIADTTVVTGFSDVLATADACLFRAKSNGRDRVEVASAA